MPATNRVSRNGIGILGKSLPRSGGTRNFDYGACWTLPAYVPVKVKVTLRLDRSVPERAAFMPGSWEEARLMCPQRREHYAKSPGSCRSRKVRRRIHSLGSAWSSRERASYKKKEVRSFFLRPLWRNRRDAGGDGIIHDPRNPTGLRKRKVRVAPPIGEILVKPNYFFIRLLP